MLIADLPQRPEHLGKIAAISEIAANVYVALSAYDLWLTSVQRRSHRPGSRRQSLQMEQTSPRASARQHGLGRHVRTILRYCTSRTALEDRTACLERRRQLIWLARSFNFEDSHRRLEAFKRIAVRFI